VSPFSRVNTYGNLMNRSTNLKKNTWIIVWFFDKLCRANLCQWSELLPWGLFAEIHGGQATLLEFSNAMHNHYYFHEQNISMNHAGCRVRQPHSRRRRRRRLVQRFDVPMVNIPNHAPLHLKGQELTALLLQNSLLPHVSG
jgi:hypothetical protein